MPCHRGAAWGCFPGRDVGDHRCGGDLGLCRGVFGSLWLSSWCGGQRACGRGALWGRISVRARADGASQPWGQPGAEGQWPEGGGSLAGRFLGPRMCVLPCPWPGWPCAGQRGGGGRQAAGAGLPRKFPECRMRCKTQENLGTVLLLKPPIQGRDGGDKREEAGGRWSTEAFCVWLVTDAGAAADSPDAPAAPYRPFLQGRRRCTQETPPALLSL